MRADKIREAAELLLALDHLEDIRSALTADDSRRLRVDAVDSSGVPHKNGAGLVIENYALSAEIIKMVRRSIQLRLTEELGVELGPK